MPIVLGTFTCSWKGLLYCLLLFIEPKRSLFIGCYERPAMLISLMEAADWTMKPLRYCSLLCFVQHKPLSFIDKFSLSLRRKRTQTPANMVINVLIANLIPANPIKLFSNRAQANTNHSGAERSIIELSRMFDYQMMKINRSK